MLFEHVLQDITSCQIERLTGLLLHGPRQIFQHRAFVLELKELIVVVILHPPEREQQF